MLRQLLKTLKCLVRLLPRCGRTPVQLLILLRNSPGQRVVLIGEDMLVLTAVQKVALSVMPVDAAGNPAPVESVAWTVSDPTMLEVVPSADGLSAVCTAMGPVGMAQVVVTADADMGEGVVTIQGTLDVQVISGMAVALAVNAGAPEPK